MNKIDFSRRYLAKWFVIILAVKLLLFSYFAIQFSSSVAPKRIHSGIAIVMGDTRNYYEPAEDFVKTGIYDSACRMPGLLPFYVPVSWLFGMECAYFTTVVLQFLLSILSVLLLAIIASRIFPRRYVFELTASVYAISTFVSIWDHALMADSFSVSLLIFSVYCLIRYFEKEKLSLLFLAGFWLAWSIFLRQIAVVLLPAFCVFLVVWQTKSFRKHVLQFIILSTPVLLSIGIWTYRNYAKEHQFIPFIKPVADCYGAYTPPYLAVTSLLVTWGEDIQYWIPNTPAGWFNASTNQEQLFPRRRSLETSICTNDSIIKLQNTYAIFRTSKDLLERTRSAEYVLGKCELYQAAYKQEKWPDYYMLNRLKMFTEFVFPERLDNMPGPEFDKRSLIQKVEKVGYYLLLITINFFGVISTLWFFYKRRWKVLVFAAIPWSLIVMLSVIFGFIEQRYLVPVYPFFLVMGVGFLTEIFGKRSRGQVEGFSKP